jgi:hypothetical protein
MQRGEMSLAKSFAEQLLRQKLLDPPAAAVGGYYLLRVRDVARLHDWAENLANWFPWMADGAIIRAWQLIDEVRRRHEQVALELGPVRDRLLEAVARGLPLYTEGLRLLRDGLMLIENTVANGPSVGHALEQVNAYTEASDPAASATTFTGMRPDKPAAKPRRGARGLADAPFAYVYDVPLRAALAKGVLEPGAIITATTDAHLKVHVQSDGTLRLDDDRTFAMISEVAVAVGDPSLTDYWSWVVGREKRHLAEVVRPLRDLPQLTT